MHRTTLRTAEQHMHCRYTLQIWINFSTTYWTTTSRVRTAESEIKTDWELREFLFILQERFGIQVKVWLRFALVYSIWKTFESVSKTSSSILYSKWLKYWSISTEKCINIIGYQGSFGWSTPRSVYIQRSVIKRLMVYLFSRSVTVCLCGQSIWRLYEIQ